jgi:hypothetical protein
MLEVVAEVVMKVLMVAADPVAVAVVAVQAAR